MALKRVFAPHLGKNIVLGGSRPITSLGPHLVAEDYLLASLLAPPNSCDYVDKAVAALKLLYGNADYGDCVIAEAYHMVGVETGNAGKIFIATLAQILHDYSAIGGFVQGDPSTDNGCDPVTALNWWLANGFANGTKPAGWMTVNSQNQTVVKQAAYLFENLDICIALPDAWINPFPSKSGFVWDVAGDPDPNNGHCICGVDYNPKGVVVCTWGLVGTITWAALARYATLQAGGQLFAVLTPDQVAKGRAVAPNGVSWTNLLADFKALGGKVASSAPPAPAASGLVTLADALGWANQGLGDLSSITLRSRAMNAVKAALTKGWPTQS
jgi:hypothetical protein